MRAQPLEPAPSRPWTDRERAAARDLAGYGYGPREIASRLDRDAVEVAFHLAPVPPSTTPPDDPSAVVVPFPTRRIVTTPSLVRALRVVGLDPAEAASPSRRRDVVLRRQAAMWILHRVDGFSTTLVGRWLGGRHHTTVVHGVRRAEARMAAGGCGFRHDAEGRPVELWVRSLECELSG